MLESIVTECHWLAVLPESMFDPGSQVSFVSALTLMNLAVLAKRGCFRTFPMRPLQVWQAGNVSIALWLLGLVVIRMGAQ